MNEIILGFLLGILAGVMGTVLLGLDLRLFVYMTLTRVQKGIQDGINEGLIERTEGGYRLTQKGRNYVENMLLEETPKGKAARMLMRRLEFMEREKLTK